MATQITRQNVIVEYISKSAKFKDDQKQIAKSTAGLGKLFKSVGSQIVAFASVGVAIAVFKDAAKTISEFEQSLKQLESLTGLSEETVGELGEAAIKMSKRFGTSARDIVAGFAKVGSASPQLLGNADALAEVTAQADILSKAGGITLDEAITALTSTMNQYGIEASEAATITDILSTSQQLGTARVTEIAAAMKNVGGAAASLGIGVAETNSILQALAKNSIVGSEAGIKLRNVLVKLASSGRDDLNPATQKFSDILEVLAKEGFTDATKASKFFGAQNFVAAQALIQNRDVVEDLTEKLNDEGNALEQATINTDTSAAAADRAAASWTALILSIDDGNGVISKTSKALSEMAITFFDALAALNNFDRKELGLSFNEFSDLVVNKTGIIKLEILTLQQELQKLHDAEFGELDILAIENKKLAIIDLRIQAAVNLRELAIKGSNEEIAAEKRRLELLEIRKDILFEIAAAEERLGRGNEDDTGDGGDAEKEFETLAKLKVQLADLKKARLGINIVKTDELAINEKLTRDLEKRIKALSISNKKETGDKLKAQQEAAKKIEILQVALIEDETERKIASLELNAKHQIAAAKGTEKQIAEFRLLTEIKTDNDIIMIRQAMLDKIEADSKKHIADTAKEEEERLLAADIAAAEAQDLVRQREILAVKKQQVAGTLSAQEAADQITLIELNGLKDRLDDLHVSGADKIALKQAIADAEIAIEEEKNSRIEEADAELRKLRQEAVVESVQLITTILNEVFKAEQERIEKSISLQEERVTAARKIAEEGNAEILQLEEERLLKLNQAREKAARKQRAIQAIQIAANAALTISNTIAGVAKTFSESGPIGAIVAAVTIAATVASAIIAMRNAISSVPTFAEGVDVLRGAGTATSDSIPAMLSKGERVVPSGSNDKLVKMGVTNDNIVAVAAAGMAAIEAPALSSAAFGINPGTLAASDIKGLRSDLKANTKAIENLGISANIDADGFTATLGKLNKFRERRNKML